MKRRDFIVALGSTVGANLAGCRLAPLVSDRAEAAAGPLRAIRVHQDLCIGCRLCEEACREATVETGRSSQPLISVHSFPGPYHVAWACPGCPDVPCIRACDYYADPLRHVKALRIDPATGAIALDRHWCSGCERCIEACEREGAAVLRWDDDEYIAGACHLCDGEPACVAACPVEAIELVDVERDRSLRPRAMAEAVHDGIVRVHGREPLPGDLRPDAAPLRALLVDHDCCTGCRLCELVCNESKAPRVAGGRSLAGPGDGSHSLIRVHDFPGPFYVAWSCLGCPDLPCVAACEDECFGQGQHCALHVDVRTGALAFEADLCLLCERCVNACRDDGGGVLGWDEAELVTGLCDHCGGEPACVRECPLGAIAVVDVDRAAELTIRRPEAAAAEALDRIYEGRPVR